MTKKFCIAISDYADRYKYEQNISTVTCLRHTNSKRDAYIFGDCMI